MTDEQLIAFMRDRENLPWSSRLLGFEFIGASVEGGWAEMAFHPTKDMTNRIGSVQGGFVTAMLDDAMGFAGLISRRFEVLLPTLQLTTTYLNPTPAGRVIGRGEVVRMGRNTALLEGSLRLPDGTPLATATCSSAVKLVKAT
ncbi:MAG: hypothetical protein RL291_1112 [Pseudomonadota bacterium]|jgi:uncharacterized protein (TIGR00369 family)